jgi:hypothetical protein
MQHPCQVLVLCQPCMPAWGITDCPKLAGLPDGWEVRRQQQGAQHSTFWRSRYLRWLRRFFSCVAAMRRSCSASSLAAPRLPSSPPAAFPPRPPRTSPPLPPLSARPPPLLPPPPVSAWRRTQFPAKYLQPLAISARLQCS